MCLFVKSDKKGNIPQRSIAKKPIRCLKIAIKATRTTESGETETVYYPPFMYYLDVVYRIGQSVCYNPHGYYRPFGAHRLYSGKNRYNCVVDFGLHAWNPKSKSCAMKIMFDYVKDTNLLDMQNYKGGDLEVVLLECEIPVGAEYFKGLEHSINSHNERRYGSAYASTNLEVIREVGLHEI